MRRGWLLLACALVLGGLATRLTAGWLDREAAARASGAEIATVEIIVAETDLNPGDTLMAGRLRWQPWPVTALRPEHLVKGRADPSVYRGSMVQGRIFRGEPLLPAHLVPHDGKGVLAALVAPGLRAITIPVSASSGLAGFVGPGDRVDIILTATLRQGGRILGQTVAENVRVLAIDQRVGPIGPTARDGEVRVTAPTTVTLEVSPRSAEKIAVAQELGRLSLSLRDLKARRQAAGSDLAGEGPGRIWDSDITRLPVDSLSGPPRAPAMMMSMRSHPLAAPAISATAASRDIVAERARPVSRGADPGVQVVRGNRGDGTASRLAVQP
ncbi:MAG: Flp pilus assembly protein CpaB [Sphingomonadaceae bacterium]